jgi:YegS/Rv2252/BmrU family lipid kinase
VSSERPVPSEAVLIVNAHSRKGEKLFQEARRKLEEAGVRLTAAHAVRDPRKLKATTDEAVRGGAPMVIVGGGDGSLSCTVDFLVEHDCVFAVLPLGTANSFARTLGLPLDLDGAIDTIANGRRRRIDLGVLNGDYFANSAAIGLSPMIGDGIPWRLKRYLGRFGYLLWASWCLLRFRPFILTVDDGNGPQSLEAVEVRIANGRYHGGVEVAEEADVESGDIVVQAVAGRRTFNLVLNWIATLLRLPARRQTVVSFRGPMLKIYTRPPLPVSIDGEVLTRTPAEARVAPCVIEVVVPREENASG